LVDVATVEAALSGLRGGYEADGYSLLTTLEVVYPTDA
jgi:hypothetical protein